jgi:hypothetical protein
METHELIKKLNAIKEHSDNSELNTLLTEATTQLSNYDSQIEKVITWSERPFYAPHEADGCFSILRIMDLLDIVDPLEPKNN